MALFDIALNNHTLAFSPSFSVGHTQYTIAVPRTVSKQVYLQAFVIESVYAPVVTLANTNGTESVIANASVHIVPFPMLPLTSQASLNLTGTVGNCSQVQYVLNFARSNITSLSALAVSPGSLSPSFLSNTFEYKSLVPAGVSSITVTASPTDPKADVNGDGAVSRPGSSDSVTRTVAVLAHGTLSTSLYTIELIWRRIVVSTSAIFVNKAVTTATYTVHLTSAPGPTDTITVIPTLASASSVLTLAPSSGLKYTASNFDIKQTVSVTYSTGATSSGSTTIQHKATSLKSDVSYQGLIGPSVTVSYRDLKPGLVLDPAARELFLPVGQSTGQYRVKLLDQPASDVTVALSSSSTDMAIANPGPLTFTPSTWEDWQVVTASVVVPADNDDVFTTAVMRHTLTSSGVTSQDWSIAPTAAPDILVVAQSTSIVVQGNPTEVVTSETGAQVDVEWTVTNSFGSLFPSLSLSIASTDNLEANVSVSSLVFTQANWNESQTVVVTGVDDDILDGNVTFSISAAPSVSLPRSGSSASVGPTISVAGINLDDEDITGSFNISWTVIKRTHGESIGTPGLAEVSLGTLVGPGDTVTLDISSSDPSEGIPSPSQLAFDTDTWSIPKTVTVTGVVDDIEDGLQSYDVIARVNPGATTSEPWAQSDVSASIEMLCLDDASGTDPVQLSKRNAKTYENGKTDFVWVVWLPPEGQDSTLNFYSSNTEEVTASPSTIDSDTALEGAVKLLFTGKDDSIDDGDQTVIILARMGPIEPVLATITVINVNDDFVGVRARIPTAYIMTEISEPVPVLVTLGSQPLSTDAIVVRVTSTNTSVARLYDSDSKTLVPFVDLQYSAATWKVAQRLFVQSVPDETHGNRNFSLRISGTGLNQDQQYSGNYSSVPLPVYAVEHPALVKLSPDTSVANGTDTTIVVSNAVYPGLEIYIGNSGPLPFANVTLGTPRATHEFLVTKERTLVALDADGGSEVETHDGAMELEQEIPAHLYREQVKSILYDQVTIQVRTPRLNATETYQVVSLSHPDGGSGNCPRCLYYTERCPQDGMYGAGLDCRPCPEGAVCPGGYRAWPIEGYWAPSEQGPVTKCLPDRCLGTQESLCAPGYTGSLCGACAQDFYLRGTACVKCSKNQGLVLTLVLVPLIFIMCIIIGIVTLPERHLGNYLVILSTLQLVRVFSYLRMESYPNEVKEIYQVATLIALDVKFARPECDGSIGVRTLAGEFWTIVCVDIAMRIGVIALAPVYGLLETYRAKRRLQAIHDSAAAEAEDESESDVSDSEANADNDAALSRSTALAKPSSLQRDSAIVRPSSLRPGKPRPAHRGLTLQSSSILSRPSRSSSQRSPRSTDGVHTPRRVHERKPSGLQGPPTKSPDLKSEKSPPGELPPLVLQTTPVIFGRQRTSTLLPGLEEKDPAPPAVNPEYQSTPSGRGSVSASSSVADDGGEDDVSDVKYSPRSPRARGRRSSIITIKRPSLDLQRTSFVPPGDNGTKDSGVSMLTPGRAREERSRRRSIGIPDSTEPIELGHSPRHQRRRSSVFSVSNESSTPRSRRGSIFVSDMPSIQEDTSKSSARRSRRNSVAFGNESSTGTPHKDISKRSSLARGSLARNSIAFVGDSATDELNGVKRSSVIGTDRLDVHRGSASMDSDTDSSDYDYQVIKLATFDDRMLMGQDWTFWERTRMRVSRGMIVLSTITYFTLWASTLKILYCKRDQETDRLYLVHEPDTTCYEGGHTSVAACAYILMVLYLVAAPIACAYIFIRHRSFRSDITRMKKYGPLVEHVRERVEWFSFALLAALATLAMAAILMTGLSQTLLMLFVFSVQFIGFLIWRPYLRPWKNKLAGTLSFLASVAALSNFAISTKANVAQIVLVSSVVVIGIIVVVIYYVVSARKKKTHVATQDVVVNTVLRALGTDELRRSTSSRVVGEDARASLQASQKRELRRSGAEATTPRGKQQAGSQPSFKTEFEKEPAIPTKERVMGTTLQRITRQSIMSDDSGESPGRDSSPQKNLSRGSQLPTWAQDAPGGEVQAPPAALPVSLSSPPGYRRGRRQSLMYGGLGSPAPRFPTSPARRSASPTPRGRSKSEFANMGDGISILQPILYRPSTQAPPSPLLQAATSPTSHEAVETPPPMRLDVPRRKSNLARASSDGDANPPPVSVTSRELRRSSLGSVGSDVRAPSIVLGGPGPVSADTPATVSEDGKVAQGSEPYTKPVGLPKLMRKPGGKPGTMPVPQPGNKVRRQRTPVSLNLPRAATIKAPRRRELPTLEKKRPPRIPSIHPLKEPVSREKDHDVDSAKGAEPVVPSGLARTSKMASPLTSFPSAPAPSNHKPKASTSANDDPARNCATPTISTGPSPIPSLLPRTPSPVRTAGPLTIRPTRMPTALTRIPTKRAVPKRAPPPVPVAVDDSPDVTGGSTSRHPESVPTTTPSKLAKLRRSLQESKKKKPPPPPDL
eukprot:TRINITY_DN484_c0_g1_i9.p1 TRINITY_DN484_c0_g1~~TRINITY_DN484_c0_g1_i9.p1  ORF type:complete len:2450 (-),score=221.17 TRINITY_DN484_c0_g1_i9:258-7607(-)